MTETIRGVTESGLFEIDAADYHACPCPEPALSNSLLKPLLALSPRHAWQASPRLNPNFEPEESARFDLGSTVHALALEKGRALHIIDAPDFRTKAAKEARDAARGLGKIPVLAKQYETALEIAQAARKQLEDFPGAEGALDLARGQTEIGLFWQDEAGCWGRNLIDRLLTDGPIWTVFDLKTLGRSARPDDGGLGVHFCEMGYDTQAAMQERGLLRVFPELAGRLQFRFIFVEIEPPYMLSVVEPDVSTMTIARKKVDTGFRLWTECLRTRQFPGYPRRVVPLRHAEFLANRWLERELADEHEREVMPSAGYAVFANETRPQPSTGALLGQDDGAAGAVHTILDAG